MFEAAKLGRKLSKGSYKEEVPQLRADLLEAQRQLKDTNTSVVILIAGVEGAGKGEVVNRLSEWLDTRGVQTFAFWDETGNALATGASGVLSHHEARSPSSLVAGTWIPSCTA